MLFSYNPFGTEANNGEFTCKNVLLIMPLRRLHYFLTFVILMFCPLMRLFQTYIAPFMSKSDETIVNTSMVELTLLIILVNKSNQIGKKNLLKYFLTLIPEGFMNYIN